MKHYIKENLMDHIKVMNTILSKNYILSQIEGVAKDIVNCYKNGKKVITLGNGGSAADAEHCVAELMGRFKKDRAPLEAIALTANDPTNTAIANDYGYEHLFERLITGYAKKGDVVIAISTSGNSANIIYGVRKAKELETITVGLTGSDKCLLEKEFPSYIIKVPSDDTPRIQEAHTTIIHLICGLVEAELFK